MDHSFQLDVSEKRDKNAEAFDKEELYKINQSERLKSLLYFENALTTIKEEIRLEISNPEENIDDSKENIESGKEIVITSSDNLKAKKKQSGLKKNGTGVFTPKDSDERKLKEMGNTSEKIVFKHLKDNNYEGVDWVARDNESLHCDIRYIDKNGTLKYVEVKTFDGGRFFLSKSEYQFGLSEQENYEIWLVRNKHEIIPITDFFSNSKYDPITSEYEIFLDLE